MGKLLSVAIALTMIMAGLFVVPTTDALGPASKDLTAENPPGPVISLEAISGVGKVLVTWYVPENGATDYQVYQGSDDNLTNATLVGDVTHTYWFDDKVVDGSIIFYFVEAVNDAGAGPVSLVMATPGIDTPPTSIRIDNDELLIGQQSFYGWPGVGTPSDPITIANLDLDAEGQGDGLFLGNTTYYIDICDGSVRNTTAIEYGDYTYSAGVALYNATNVSIDNMTLTGNEGFGVVFDNARQCRVNGSLVNGSESGITLMGSSNCYVVENKVFGCIIPIEVYSSGLCGIQDNEIGRDGENISEVLLVLNGENCSVSGNIFHGNHLPMDEQGGEGPGYGIMLSDSGNFIYENTFLNCSIVMEMYTFGGLDGNQIFDNSVNGKPIYYYHDLDMTAIDIPTDAGEVLLYNCTNATVQGLEQNSSSIMVQAVYCHDIVIRNNTARDCQTGIWLALCFGNVLVEDNVISDCNWGIFTKYFDDNRISDNDISSCNVGTYMEHWNHRNNVTGNRYENGTYGLFFGYANNMNVVQGNLFINNSDFAVFFDSGSFNNMVFLNEFRDNNGAGEEYDEAHSQARDYKSKSSPGNLWQNGTNGPGNLWSDLTGPDADLDGFVDAPYSVMTYPFMGVKDLRPLAYLEGPPGRVSDLNASASDGSVRLQWGPANNSDIVGSLGYRVYRWDQYDQRILVADIAYLNYSEGGLDNGVWYVYQVSAYNERGEGPLSQNLTVVPNTIPGSPVNVTGTISDGEAVIQWEPPLEDGGAEILWYEVFRDGELVTNVTGTSATIGDHSLGVPYAFLVRAHNLNGFGPASETIVLIERTVPDAPHLEATWGDGRASLSWSTPDNGGSAITAYVVYKQWHGLSNWTELVRLSSNNYTDDALINGYTYAYKVCAVNAIGNGSASNEVRDSPRGLPSAPELHTLNPGDGQLHAAWSAPDNDGGSAVIEYVIYLDGVLYGNATGMSLNISGLNNGAAYSVTVRAKTAVGIGPLSAPMTATPFGPPGPPTELVASVGPNTIVLNWSPSTENGGAGLVQYRVYVTYSGGSALLLATTNATSYGMEMSLDDEGVSRMYLVQSFNAQGIGGNSSTQGVVPLVLYVTGTVVNEDGLGISGISIRSQTGGQTLSDSNGVFALLVWPGEVNLTIEGTGYLQRTIQMDVNEAPVDLGPIYLSPLPEDGTISVDFAPIILLVLVTAIAIGGAFLFLRRRH